MKIFDTARQEIVTMEAPSPVRIYCCGITPYDAAHMGHASVYLTFDVLQRRLNDMGVETRCVRNVTDVDDDILRRSKELGVHYLDLAAEEMARFDRDMSALGLLAPDVEPRATSAIPMILTLIEKVLDNGYAYESGGAVYFSVSSFPSFGSVSHLSRETMIELAAERGGRIEDPAKRDPLDFVLWQPSLPGEPSWDSRWGPGRPGWHIECSALAVRELGTVDLHGGGNDLIFPHHECETAQAEAATGKSFCKYWMHVGMVGLDGVKMSKSLGNLVFVHDLLEKWNPMAIRLAVISNHYRSDWDWSDQMLEDAAERLERWESAGEGDRGMDRVRDCLDNDLDVPSALEVLDRESKLGGVSVPAQRLLGVRY
jgi:L-cysteine:1D-myo-inositol 2-amino-2-deoxy-alpha-D-glucopyranoside ligase